MAMDRPLRGREYPGSYGELLAWFRHDADCRDYLEWLRWPVGFACPHCGVGEGWGLSDGRWSCARCARRVSVTAGTIFDGTRTPLTVWFAAAWQMTSQKNGISALGLQRVLGLGSYQTAWAMLHRYRRATVRPDRDLLSGVVEVDESIVGGVIPWVRGREIGKNALVAIAVEQHEHGLGRCRMQVIDKASSAVLGAFINANVTPDSTIVTDGWPAYYRAVGKREHVRHVLNRRGSDAHELLPGVHRVTSLAKRWLLGTHQGSVSSTHLQDYLDEFTFRFNRRTSRARGLLFLRLLEQAVATDPVRYNDLVVEPGTGNRRANAPTARRPLPASLDQPSANRPWRHNDPNRP